MTEKLTDEMKRRLAKLDALEAGGVDNWEWYGESLQEWFKDNEVAELIDKTLDEIDDVLVESEVDQPAGPGCGYAIRVPENDMRALLTRFAEQIREMDK